ncbi:MAG: hypothetical protein Q9214_007931, partial [Letrouitia sp. 1 TL-2023]
QNQLPTVNYPAQQQGLQGQVTMSGMSPHANAFQFPQQQLGVPVNAPTQPSSHRRNQSALSHAGLGPPPAPSSGASGSSFGDYSQQNTISQNRENGSQRGRGGGASGSGHQRRHSLALPEAKKAAELAQQKRTTSGFQFPIPGASGASPTSATRSDSPAGSDDKSTEGQQSQPTSTEVRAWPWDAAHRKAAEPAAFSFLHLWRLTTLEPALGGISQTSNEEEAKVTVVLPQETLTPTGDNRTAVNHSPLNNSNNSPWETFRHRKTQMQVCSSQDTGSGAL